LFTGIVFEVGRVVSAQTDKLVVGANQILKGLQLGGSVAVNGACLTVTRFDAGSFAIDLSPETVKRTNLGMLKTGAPVNLERPLGLGGELGGHLVQGHIDGTGKIIGIAPEGDSTVFRFEAPQDIMRYLVEKGFIAVEGISLTITGRGDRDFLVSVIDYTRTHTNLEHHRIGDTVNLEVDIMAKYAERFMQAQSSNLTIEFLRQSGF
jgi:riboflavin synthase